MCKLANYVVTIYLVLYITRIRCLDDEYSEDDYELFDYLEDNNFEKLVNLIDSEILDVTQNVDNLVSAIDQNTVNLLESSLIQTSSIAPTRIFMSSRPESDSDFRRKMINKIEKQIKKDLREYKFSKANKLTCLRRHLLVEHDRLNELERIKTYQNLELVQSSLGDHISWFTNYSEHLLNKENRNVEEEFIDGNGIVEILISFVNRKFIYPNQPFKIKKNKNNVVYSLKPFVILDARIESKNSTQQVSLKRSSPFYLKNNVVNNFYILKGNLSLSLVLNMKNQFELLYNYVFNTSIDTNLIGSVEIRYYYEQFKFDITQIEISDFEHFDITNNFNFFQGLIINPVLNTVKGRIMETIKIEANKFLNKLVTPFKMKYIFDIIK